MERCSTFPENFEAQQPRFAVDGETSSTKKALPNKARHASRHYPRWNDQRPAVVRNLIAFSKNDRIARLPGTGAEWVPDADRQIFDCCHFVITHYGDGGSLAEISHPVRI